MKQTTICAILSALLFFPTVSGFGQVADDKNSITGMVAITSRSDVKLDVIFKELPPAGSRFVVTIKDIPGNSVLVQRTVVPVGSKTGEEKNADLPRFRSCSRFVVTRYPKVVRANLRGNKKMRSRWHCIPGASVFGFLNPGMEDFI